MNFEFSFQNEIECTTELPADFDALRYTLRTLFQADLPLNFSIYFLDSNNNKVIISSSEDYRILPSSNSAGYQKFFICEGEDDREVPNDMEDCEIIDHALEKLSIGEIDFEEVEEPATQDDSIEEIKEVKEEPELERGKSQKEVGEEYQILISRPIESSGSESVSNTHNISQEQEEVIKHIEQETQAGEIQAEMVRSQSFDTETQIIQKKEDQAIESFIDAEVQTAINQHQSYFNFKAIILEMEKKNQEKKKEEQRDKGASEGCGLFAPLKDLGRKVSGSLKGFSNMAREVSDDLSHIIQGDPKIYYHGNRYPQSIYIKTEELKQIFPEEDPEGIFNFVQQTDPRHLSVNQMVDIYMAK
jgi:hypothetical protein